MNHEQIDTEKLKSSNQGEGDATFDQSIQMILPPAWLTRAVKDCAGITDTDAYEELLQQPNKDELIKEVHPNWFLMRENGDTNAAAQRYAYFWKHRKEYFGERTFRPLLDCSGQGALSKEDFELYQKGFVISLPSNTQGLPVAFNDVSKLGQTAKQQRPSHARLRCVFYTCCRIARDFPVSRTSGAICIRVITGVSGHDQKHRGKVPDLLANAFPMKINRLLICVIPPSAKEKRTLTQVMAPLFQKMMTDLPKTALIIRKDDPQGILQELMTSHGLLKEGLPPSVGGTWSYTTPFAHLQVTTAPRSYALEHLQFLLARTSDSKAVPRATCFVEKRKATKRKIQKTYQKSLMKLSGTQIPVLLPPTIAKVDKAMILWNLIRQPNLQARRQHVKQKLRMLHAR